MFRGSNQSFFPLLILFIFISIGTLCAEEIQHKPRADVTLLTEHVYFLTSEELQGRKAGTYGCDSAADYIADYFESVGLIPANPNDGGYFQKFEITMSVEHGDLNSLLLDFPDGDLEVKLSADFAPYVFSSNGFVEGDVVFAGYGIRSDEFSRDDYEGIDVDGKIVLCYSGQPDAMNGSQSTIFGSPRYKALTAMNRGASAILIASFTNGIPGNEKHLVVQPDKKNSPSLAELGIPAVYVSNEIAEILLASVGITEPDKELGSMLLEGVRADFTVELKRENIVSSNVAGYIEGDSPEWVIIGAHYDHLGVESVFDDGSMLFYPGADDNASGTAGVLELARLFSESPDMPGRNIMFICFTAEEIGQIGSAYYVENPLVPLDKTSAMVNMDMIGRVVEVDGEPACTIQGENSASEWIEIIPERTPDNALRLLTQPNPIGGSDYIQFLNAGIPSINFFSSAHDDYHKPTDTPDKINFAGMVSVVEAVYEIGMNIADWPEMLTFSRPSRGMGHPVGAGGPSYSVFLGTIPDFAHTEGGFFISGVVEGSPADIAGLRPGDRIVKLDDYEVDDIHSYTSALGNFQPGDSVTITVIRDGVEIIFAAVLATRNQIE